MSRRVIGNGISDGALLVITSVLMVGQHFLEKKFSRGASRQLTARQLRVMAEADGVTPSAIMSATGNEHGGGPQ